MNKLMTTTGGEEWRKVTGYEGIWVSNKGRVFHEGYSYVGNRGGVEHMKYRKAKILTNSPSGGRGEEKYMMVGFKIGGKAWATGVHRLMAIAFIKGQFEGAVVNHKDGNRMNNRLSNLEWLSNGANIKHGYELRRLNRKRA